MSKQKRKSSKKSTGPTAEVTTANETPAPVEAASAANTEGKPVASADANEVKASEVAEPAKPPVPTESASALPRLSADGELAPADLSDAPPAVAAPTPSKPVRRRKKAAAKSGERVSEMPPTVREGKSQSEMKVAAEVLDKKLENLDKRLEQKIDAHKAAKQGLAGDPDDTSIPPVVEHEHEESFFAGGEHAHKNDRVTGTSGSFDAVDPKHLQKMTPAAKARRAHLSRYVKIAVAASAAVLLAAFVRVSLTSKKDDTHVQAQANVAQIDNAPANVVAQGNVGKAPDTTGAAVVENVPPPVDTAPPTDMAGGDAKAPETADAKDAAAPVNPVGVMGDGTAKPKTAWQEKASAKAALESGNNAGAISAGERSVGLDATDGEAWLVLGAAYQAQGNVTQAKRCFNACISQGKKGPIDECRSMLAQ